MGAELIFIRRIFQSSPAVFTVEWTDGKLVAYRLSLLQRRCPCARCRDEKTGKVLIDPETIPEDLEAVKIVSVGRYALQIFFTSGCSQGIYTYQFLREFNS